MTIEDLNTLKNGREQEFLTNSNVLVHYLGDKLERKGFSLTDLDKFLEDIERVTKVFGAEQDLEITTDELSVTFSDLESFLKHLEIDLLSPKDGRVINACFGKSYGLLNFKKIIKYIRNEYD